MVKCIKSAFQMMNQIDLRRAAEFFHGGGHLNASGGELPFPLSEAVETAERAIEAYADLL